MSAAPIELTEAEWSVIKAVWQGAPCTAPEVQQRLAATTGWTYSTVRTLMDRMVAKGLLSAVKDGKITRFRPAITRVQAQWSELRYALRQAFDGALTPLVQCLFDHETVTERELAQIEAMIRARKRQTRK
jgi:BlaI family transcriptional regulator, penicillinase repressor